MSLNSSSIIHDITRRRFMVFLASTSVATILSGCDKSILRSGEEIDLTNSTDTILREQNARLQVILIELHTQVTPHIAKGGYMLYQLPNAMMIQSIGSDKITLQYNESGILMNQSEAPITLGSKLGQVLVGIELDRNHSLN